MTSAASPEAAGPTAPTEGLTVRLARDASGIAVTAGILSALLGLTIVVWPEATIAVVAVLFGLKLIVHGVYRIAQAIVAGDESGGTRTLYALLGVLSFAVGVLALRHLLQTVAVLALLFGLFWITVGVIEFVTAVTGRGGAGRGAGIALSLLSVLAGVLVLGYPGITLVALTWLLGVWLFTWGLITAGVTLWLRRAERRAAHQ